MLLPPAEVGVSRIGIQNAPKDAPEDDELPPPLEELEPLDVELPPDEELPEELPPLVELPPPLEELEPLEELPPEDPPDDELLDELLLPDEEAPGEPPPPPPPQAVSTNPTQATVRAKRIMENRCTDNLSSLSGNAHRGTQSLRNVGASTQLVATLQLAARRTRLARAGPGTRRPFERHQLVPFERRQLAPGGRRRGPSAGRSKTAIDF